MVITRWCSKHMPPQYRNHKIWCPFKPHPSRSAIRHHLHPQLTALFNSQIWGLIQNTEPSHIPAKTVISNNFLCFDHTWCLFGTELRRLWVNYVTFNARCHARLINSTKLKRSTQFLNICGHVRRPVRSALKTRIHGTLMLSLLKPSLQWVTYRLDDTGLEPRLQGPPSLLFNGYRAFYPEVKQPGRDVDHIPLASAEVKNEWS